MNNQECQNFVDHLWDQSIIPTLMEYIHIPNKSPMFDPQWQTNGHMDKAVKLMVDWCKKNKTDDMKIEVVRLENRTPLIFIEIPGNSDETILMYGHMDKQPEMKGWDSDLAPWKPVLKGDKLYGRGGADDGYAIFASLAAIKALKAQNIPHARIVIIIEGCEESGSYDLPYYMDALESRIGKPNLVICLDSGCGNYDQLWVTTSLRGLIGGNLHINILKQGIHSGLGSGVVPSCFLILRQLLSRLEDEATGQIKLAELQCKIPEQRIEQVGKAADVLDSTLYSSYPFTNSAKPVSDNVSELLLNRTWRAALSVTGANGLPLIEDAGNVTLPHLTVKLSMRVPPTCDAELASKTLKKVLEENPPYHAGVQFDLDTPGSGWNAPEESTKLSSAIDNASQDFFGKGAVYLGEGGSIPFMGMLGKKFPHAQFLITGVLGPASNAHGPNEFLHIPTGKKLTCCIASVIADHFS